VGFSFLCNATGRLFTKGQISLSDVDANYDPIYCVMKVSHGTGRYSAHLLKEAIIKHYEWCKLYPCGITSCMQCIQDWALKLGKALQRLVSRFRRLYRLAASSKKSNIRRLKKDLEGQDFVPGTAHLDDESEEECTEESSSASVATLSELHRSAAIESTLPKLPGALGSSGQHGDQKIMDVALQLKAAREHAAKTLQKNQLTPS
ncbi:unnamed protein product, partial [Durusdinium trenchii]